MSAAPGSTAAGPPWQFALRAALVVSGLTLLLVVNVRGLAFYVAWTLIVIALLSEGLATFVYWRRARGRS